MVELRKRPARAEPPAAPPAKRSSSSKPAGSKVKAAVSKAKEAITGKPADAADTKAEGTTTASTTNDLPVASGATGAIPETTGTAGETSGEAAPATTSAVAGAGASAGVGSASGAKGGETKLSKESVGKKVDLEGNAFGGTVTTHDGKSVSLGQLAKGDAGRKGVVVFTYPKASTPGCTTQACLFRDNYKPITDAGYAVYGLSSDSEKANGSFVTKQSLPYPLLCDPNATLTSAIGLKKPGPGKGTLRGVVLIDREGEVKIWEQAGPQKTLDVVLDFIKG